MRHTLGNAIGMSKKIAKKTLRAGYRTLMRMLLSFADHKYLDSKVPLSKFVGHSTYLEYLWDCGDRKGMRIPEVGSREVTGKSDTRKRLANADSVGFDFYPGSDVDVVGDAHRLTQYFDNQRFDIICSSAVFEHFAMPWVVATEIARLLKPGRDSLCGNAFFLRIPRKALELFPV